MNSGKRERPHLTDAQLEVMHAIWDRGEAAVTDVWQDLCKQREIARNTVLTVMDRLAGRGWLEKRVIGNTHLYRPTVSRKKALGNVVKRLVETAFSGSADRLVMALLDGRGVSKDEADRIREMIDQSRKKKQNRRK